VRTAKRDSDALATPRLKDIADICQSLVTVVGILAAGIWFLLQQQCGPKVKIEHRISHRQSAAEASKNLVGIDVFVSNVGNVGVTLECGHLRVLNVNPGPANGDPEYIWPSDVVHPKSSCLETTYIEPNGSDQAAHEEILVDRGVKTIRVRSFFKNPTAKTNTGWELITLYDLDSGQLDSKSTMQTSLPQTATPPQALAAGR